MDRPLHPRLPGVFADPPDVGYVDAVLGRNVVEALERFGAAEVRKVIAEPGLVMQMPEMGQRSAICVVLGRWNS